MNKLSTRLTCLLFVCLFLFGTYLSTLRPLWNDEIHTHIYNIDGKGFVEILKGELSVEGNNAPLFYFLQKAYCQLVGYEFSIEWNREWVLYDQSSQIILRVLPNFFMSLGLALIFYFFAKYYNFSLAILALVISLSSYMVWSYWVEARPYSLWFCLSSIQALVFLRILNQKEYDKHLCCCLFWVHLLLSLTVFLSLLQIGVVLLLLYAYKRIDWPKLIWMGGIPIAVCCLYYLKSNHHKFWFLYTPKELFLMNYPKEWLIVLAACAMCCFLFKDSRRERAKDFLWLSTLMILAAGALLGYLGIKQSQVNDGFAISYRYFIFLVPVGIIATTYFSYFLITQLKGYRWAWINTWIMLIGLLLIRLIHVSMDVYAAAIYC